MSEAVRYHVRTPMGLWLTNGLVTAACVLVVIANFALGYRIPGFVLLVLSLVVTSTVGFWLSFTAYRVGGGRNLIRIHADRIEVPSTTQRKPMVFPRAGTELEISDVLVRYRHGLGGALASINHGKMIQLRNAGMSRKLSTLVLDESADEMPLVADLRRFIAGEPALGRAGHAAAAMQRNDYDDRLDRELAQLD